MSLSAFRKLVGRIYAVEIMTIALLLYVLGAFIHLSANPEQWAIVTRIILGAILAGFVLFSMVVGSLKGGGK
ncbi:hypothetical protein ACM66T_10190 [Sulfurimonas sp. ST-25]|uniref:hypothetical protein n=1 Tax=Sulfurimonas sp. ST-25 TaxID=3400151 RepID=UPI003A895EDB